MSLFKPTDNIEKELNKPMIVFSIIYLIITMVCLCIFAGIILDNLEYNNKYAEDIKGIELIANDLIKNDNLEVQDIGLKLLKIKNIDNINLNSNQKESAIIDNLIDIRLEINELLSEESILEYEYLREASKEIDSIIQEINN